MGKEPAAKLDGGCGRCVLAPELGRAASSLTHPSSWERGKATLQDTALHPAATRGSSWLPQDGGDTAELPGACPRALRHCWHCRRQQGTGRAQCGDSPVSACPCCSLAVSPPQPTSVLPQHAALGRFWPLNGLVVGVQPHGQGRWEQQGAPEQAGLSPAALPAGCWGSPRPYKRVVGGAAAPCSCGGAEWAARGHRARRPPR